MTTGTLTVNTLTSSLVRFLMTGGAGITTLGLGFTSGSVMILRVVSFFSTGGITGLVTGLVTTGGGLLGLVLLLLGVTGGLVTGLVLTKLDGTAKGGVVAAIVGQYAQNNPPALRFIGVGEGIDDLRPFNAQEFVDAMFD